MFIDHLGFMVFTDLSILRIIGRIAYPIFAFMLVEGCFYTKNRFKHFFLIFVFGIVFQIFYYLFMERLDFSIFIIFSISIALIYLLDLIIKNITNKKYLIGILLLLSFIGLTVIFYYLDNRYYYFDYSYGFIGIMVPVIFYIFRRYVTQNMFILLPIFTVLIFLIPIFGGLMENIYMLFASLFLLLYNGTKGKKNLKYFFYAFYPAHIVIVYILYLII